VECSLSTGGIAILQYTSGSTSLPKGVVISHANLMATLSYSAEVWVGTQENPVAVSWLPPFHDLGLIFGILQPIFSGFPLYLMSPLSFLQKPRRWLAAISRYKGTLSAAPNFAYDLCVSSISRDRGAGLDLSSWKMAGNAAEPIRARTIERFSKAFEAFGFRREAFSCGYGLAEATLAVCGSDWKRAPTVIDVDTQALESGHVVLASAAARTVRSFVGCGKPQSTAISEIAIVDPATKIRCQPDRAGELWVRGAGIAQGYWMKPDDTREIFEARLADTNDGPFLRTGDLGFILDGEVFITGRLKEVLIVRGRCLYPHDLEMTVQETHQALRIGCGAAFSVEVEEQERVVIVQEIDSRRVSLNLTELHRCAQRALFERHGVTAEVIFVKRGTVPKTSSGKIRRADCRASYLQQRLDFVGLPPTAGMTMRRTLQDCSGHHG
jgi:acyl-CoA synthetase (AMP-forming)/AMP-acid ligase II